MYFWRLSQPTDLKQHIFLFSFHPQDQLREIFNTSLSSIICRNSDHVEYSQRYIMKKVTKTNNMEKCSDLDTFDFQPWREIKHEMSRVRAENGESEVKSIRNKH